MNANQPLPKHLLPGQRVSSTVGPLIPNPDQSKKRKRRSRLYGNVIEEASNRKYKVQFDDGEIRVVASNILRIEKASASLPPSERPPPLPLISEQRGDQQEDADVGQLADEESAEDELGDPDREQGGGGGENQRRKRGKVLRTPKVKLVVFLLEKTSQRIITSAFERHVKRLRVFWGKR